MNKVISYSLWGEDEKYTIGALRNAELAKSIYPDWKCIFYIGKTVPKNIVKKLKSYNNTETIETDQDDSWANMFWRFKTCYQKDIDVSIFRDTDSRLSLREKAAVDDWLFSDKTFHIMRDHPFHNFPILGGMWGYKKNNKYPMENLLKNFKVKNLYGTDYDFLGNVLYPIIKNDKLVHDEFFDNKPFPIARQNKEFVGDVFDRNDVRHPKYWQYIP